MPMEGKRKETVMRQFFDTEFLESQVFGEDAPGEEGLEGRIPGEDGTREDEPEDQALENDEKESLPVEIILTLEDGRDLTCRVAGVFMEQEKEYIALEAEEKRDDSEGKIYIMGLSQGEEDEIELRPLVDKEEQERALAAFFRMVEEEDYAAQAVFDGRLEGAEDEEMLAGAEDEKMPAKAEDGKGFEELQEQETVQNAEDRMKIESEIEDDRN